MNAISTPSGRINNPVGVKKGKKQLDKNIHTAIKTPAAALTGEPKLVFDVTKNRLKERGIQPTEKAVIEFLKEYVNKHQSGARVHLFPISETDINNLFYDVQNRKASLSIILTNSSTNWLALLNKMMASIREAYEEFLKVAQAQAQEDWLKDTRWKRFALKVLTIAISAALAGVGFGALGGVFGQLFSDAVGEAMKELTKEAIKGAIGGAMGEIGGAVSELVNTPFEMEFEGGDISVPNAEQLAYQSSAGNSDHNQGQRTIAQIAQGVNDSVIDRLAGKATSDPREFLHSTEDNLIRTYQTMNDYGAEWLIRVIEIFRRKVIKHVAWQCLFENNTGMVNETQIVNSSRFVLNECFKQIEQTLRSAFACPFKLETNARGIIEKCIWALYIKERLNPSDPKTKKRNIGNPVIDRMVQLGVGARREQKQYAWHTSDFKKESANIVASIKSATTQATDAEKAGALSAAESAMKFGKTEGGDMTDAQLGSWAEAFLSFNPMRALFAMDDKTAASIVNGQQKLAQDLEKWKQAQGKAKAAANQIIAL